MPKYRALTGIGSDSLVYEYTSSLSHDKFIEKHVVFVVAAHFAHLYEKGLVPREASCRIASALLRLLDSKTSILASDGFEDVFEALEDFLEKETGGASKYIWLGRSRNDHVSAALRLYALEKGIELVSLLLDARRSLLTIAQKQGHIPIVLHTHQQPSQIGNVACLVLGWEEALASATTLLVASLGLAARSPLGASAGAGTLAPIDPERLSELVGLQGILNSVYGAGSRFDVEAVAAAAALFLAEASRITADLITYSSPYIGVVILPSSHVATSSAMPHKRNPVTLEVLRAHGARAAGYLAAMLSIGHGLPYIYNLDLQEANPLLYSILTDAVSAARILADLFKGLVFDEVRARELVDRYGAVSVEVAEKIALVTGKPFREAYAEAAKLLREKGQVQLATEFFGDDWAEKLLEERKTGCMKKMSLGRLEARIAMDKEEIGRLEAVLGSARQRIESFLEEVANNCPPLQK
jgi:argininosuccinate lyase